MTDQVKHPSWLQQMFSSPLPSSLHAVTLIQDHLKGGEPLSHVPGLYMVVLFQVHLVYTYSFVYKDVNLICFSSLV